MELLVVRILDTGSEFRHEVLFGIEDISDSGGKGIGEFTLLKDIEVGPQFEIGRGIPALNLAQTGFPNIQPEAEYIPLPAQFKSNI